MKKIKTTIITSLLALSSFSVAQVTGLPGGAGSIPGMANPPPPMSVISAPTVIQIRDGYVDSIEQAVSISGQITQAGTQIANAIIENGNSLATLMQNSGQQVIDTQYNVASQNLEDNAKILKTLQQARMEYQQEITESKIRSSQAKIAIDDTPEEFTFMQDILEENKEKDVRQVIQYLEAKEKDTGLYVEIMPKSVKDDPERLEACQQDGANCTYEKPITPSFKMAQMFSECSKMKRTKKYDVQQAASKRSRVAKTSSKQIKSMNSSNSSVALSKEIEEQLTVSCTPRDLQSGLCGDLDKERYFEGIKEGAIIPSGNTSSANLLAPPFIPGLGILPEVPDGNTEEGKAQIEAMEELALDKTEELDENAPEIVYTYKNSNQIIAAEDMKENIINRGLISNQSAGDRKGSSSAAFQSEFLARNARLSLAEKTFDDAILERTGSKLSEFNIENPYPDEPEREYDYLDPIKESHNGAATIDLLNEQVNEDFDKVVEAITGENGMSLDSIAPANLTEWTYKTIALQNKLNQKQNDKLEKIELLLSAILSTEINSPDNIEFLQSLRGGR